MKIFSLTITKIGTKVAFAMLLAVGGLSSIFISITTVTNQRQAEEEAVLQVTEKSRLLGTTVEVLDRSLRSQVATYAKVFSDSLTGQFSVNREAPVNVAGKPVAALQLDGKALNLNFDIPDGFTARTGAYATVFVREGDDFVRVTTSHKKEDGQRAIGTLLDRAHPAYARLLSGASYAGSASLFGGQYMTHYAPVLDTAGQVIGVLYVGINFTDSVRLLGEGIKSLKLGQDGGFYVLSARPGKDLGKALVHREREGQNLLDIKDSGGQLVVSSMLSQANGLLRYTEPGKNGAGARERVAAFSTIKDWQMLVVGDAYLDEVTAGATRQRNQAIGMGLLMVLILTALLAIIIRKLVAHPFGNALRAVEKIGGGDLTGKVIAASADESGRLLASVQTMTDRLSTVVSQVRSSTDAISAISSEVAAGNMELSARTEQQAAALEQTASSMEQMNASVRNNADNALAAQALSREAATTARLGGDAVEQLVAKMDAIKASATRIADITSVVDGIAFQTNILALNAAVEAARAGEHGRGFAVVATEVRTLAHRSSTAAKEIKLLIGESLDQVASGVVLAQGAGGTMQDVVAAIIKANRTIDEISSATQEQAGGIDQINRAVAQLDQVTQQNASLVEEAAAAAQTMNVQAQHLAEVVEFFIVPPVSITVAPPATRSAPRLLHASVKAPIPPSAARLRA